MPRTQRFDNLHLEMDYLTVETNIDWVIFGHDTEQLFCRLFIALQVSWVVASSQHYKYDWCGCQHYIDNVHDDIHVLGYEDEV